MLHLCVHDSASPLIYTRTTQAQQRGLADRTSGFFNRTSPMQKRGNFNLIQFEQCGDSKNTQKFPEEGPWHAPLQLKFLVILQQIAVQDSLSTSQHSALHTSLLTK
jgi:hypothetical protein